MKYCVKGFLVIQIYCVYNKAFIKNPCPLFEGFKQIVYLLCMIYLCRSHAEATTLVNKLSSLNNVTNWYLINDFITLHATEVKPTGL